MSYLQLADQGYLAQKPNDLYVFIPQGFRGAEADSYVREDIFDNLNPNDYDQLMFELLPYQNTGMSELGDRASRKAAREEKKAAKAAKKETKGAGARRDARAERQAARQSAKSERAALRGQSGGFSGILDKVGGIAGNIMGKGASVEVDGASIAYDPGDESFFSKYKTPLLIGGGLVAIGAIYMLTKKKK